MILSLVWKQKKYKVISCIDSFMCIPENVFVFGLFSVDGEELFESAIGILLVLIEGLNPLICAYFSPVISIIHMFLVFLIKHQNS